MLINTIKNLIGIAATDVDRDELIGEIINLTKSRLKSKLGNIDIPEELEYIVAEVSVIRYNRIGSEGLSSHSVEGESQSFTDDDFKAYDGDIQTYLNSLTENKIGKVRFL